MRRFCLPAGLVVPKHHDVGPEYVVRDGFRQDSEIRVRALAAEQIEVLAQGELDARDQFASGWGASPAWSMRRW